MPASCMLGSPGMLGMLRMLEWADRAWSSALLCSLPYIRRPSPLSASMTTWYLSVILILGAARGLTLGGDAADAQKLNRRWMRCRKQARAPSAPQPGSSVGTALAHHASPFPPWRVGLSRGMVGHCTKVSRALAF